MQGGKIVAEGTNRMPKNCTGKFPWSREGKSKLDTKYPYGNSLHAQCTL